MDVHLQGENASELWNKKNCYDGNMHANLLQQQRSSESLSSSSSPPELCEDTLQRRFPHNYQSNSFVLTTQIKENFK